MSRISLRSAALGTVAALAVLAGSVGIYRTFLDGGTQQAQLSEAKMVEGRALYMEHCASCHGADLEGQENWRERRADGRLPAPPHDASGHTWHHPDSQLFAVTKHGTAAFAPEGYKTDMRGFAGEMSDADIRLVLDWIKAQWPDDIRERQAEITRRAGGEG